jgi:hypothetical protein
VSAEALAKADPPSFAEATEGKKHVIKRGKTPVLTREDFRGRSGSAGSGVAFNLDSALCGPASLGEIMGCLHPQPGVCATTESKVESNRHFRRDAAASVNQIIEGLAGDTQDLGGGSDSEPQGIKAVVLDR